MENSESKKFIKYFVIVILTISIFFNGYFIGANFAQKGDSEKKEVLVKEDLEDSEEADLVDSEIKNSDEEVDLDEAEEEAEDVTAESEEIRNYESGAAVYEFDGYGVKFKAENDLSFVNCTYNNLGDKLNDLIIGLAKNPEVCPIKDGIENVHPTFMVVVEEKGGDYFNERYSECIDDPDSQSVNVDGVEACRKDLILGLGSGYFINIYVPGDSFDYAFFGESTDFSNFDFENAEDYYEDFKSRFEKILNTVEFY